MERCINSINEFMRTEYKKIKTILRNDLRVNSSKADIHKDLANDFGFCEWEVEYLLAKVENEFNIDIVTSQNNITVSHLLQQIQRAR